VGVGGGDFVLLVDPLVHFQHEGCVDQRILLTMERY
jgi:hypothetical protein